MQTRATHREPFASRVLDDYFFATPGLRLRLDLVQEHIRCGDTAVLILGESGAGKSTLLNQLVCRSDHNWRVVRLPAVSSFSAGDVITFLNAELRLPTRVSSWKCWESSTVGSIVSPCEDRLPSWWSTMRTTSATRVWQNWRP